MADAPQTPLSSSAAIASEPEQLSHLAGLHRMSRTAGLGSSEYTAVNITAVVAVIIGAASALALMTPVFLFLPVLGVVFAAVAVKQIRSSNGTQTGLPLAVLALLLSVGLTGVTGFKYYQGVSQEAADYRDLDALLAKFGQAIADKKYADAYAMTDERFRDNVTVAQFESLFGEMAAAPTYGPLKGIRSTKLFGIDADPETGRRMAVGYALIDTSLKNGDGAIRTEMRYRNTDGVWKVYAIPQFFAAKAPAAGAAGGSGGAAGGAAAPAGPAGPPAPAGPPGP